MSFISPRRAAERFADPIARLETPAAPDVPVLAILVYFDPWMAGVVYPGLIIVGLIAITFIDTNPKGNGYYTVRGERRGEVEKRL